MTCIKCQGNSVKSSRISHALGWITENACPDCGTVQTIYDYQPGKGQELSKSVVQTAKPDNFTMDEVVSFAVPEPNGLVCPHCFGNNLGHNEGLRRHDENGITHGYICQDCGEAFIPHPELRQTRPTLLKTVRHQKRQMTVAKIMDDAMRGNGQWLKPRKDKEGDVFFEVGK